MKPKRLPIAIRAAWAVFWWMVRHNDVAWGMVDAPRERPPFTFPDEYYEAKP